MLTRGEQDPWSREIRVSVLLSMLRLSMAFCPPKAGKLGTTIVFSLIYFKLPDLAGALDTLTLPVGLLTPFPPLSFQVSIPSCRRARHNRDTAITVAPGFPLSCPRRGDELFRLQSAHSRVPITESNGILANDWTEIKQCIKYYTTKKVKGKERKRRKGKEAASAQAQAENMGIPRALASSKPGRFSVSNGEDCQTVGCHARSNQKTCTF